MHKHEDFLIDISALIFTLLVDTTSILIYQWGFKMWNDSLKSPSE